MGLYMLTLLIRHFSFAEFELGCLIVPILLKPYSAPFTQLPDDLYLMDEMDERQVRRIG